MRKNIIYSLRGLALLLGTMLALMMISIRLQ